jgi:cyclic pyranopterin phosphate synthase
MTVQLGIPALRPVLTNGQGAAPYPRPPELPFALLDRFGRQATDMRLSVTDKCNLRCTYCTYCMPAEGLQRLPSKAVMTAGD